MDPKYFNYHKLIVYAFYSLKQTSISEGDRVDSSKLIKEYASQFNILYGDKNITCVLHTPEAVKRLGPLWKASGFRFKNANGVLKYFVHEIKYAELHICSSVSLFLNYYELKEKYLRPTSKFYEFCNKLESKSRLKDQKIGHNYSIVGNCKRNFALFSSFSTLYPKYW